MTFLLMGRKKSEKSLGIVHSEMLIHGLHISKVPSTIGVSTNNRHENLPIDLKYKYFFSD